MLFSPGRKRLVSSVRKKVRKVHRAARGVTQRVPVLIAGLLCDVRQTGQLAEGAAHFPADRIIYRGVPSIGVHPAVPSGKGCAQEPGTFGSRLDPRSVLVNSRQVPARV